MTADDDVSARILPLAKSRRLMPPFPALRAFEAVGRLGGVRKAAQELGIDHSAVSRHIKVLEAWAGISLVERGHGGRLTLKGSVFHTRITAALEDICQASAQLTRRTDDENLVIWCAPGLATSWLNVRLGEFIENNPDIRLEMRPTDSSPDFSRHTADVDIRHLRNGAEVPAELMSIEIARPNVFPVASPLLIAELGPSFTPAQLASAPLLHEGDDSFWQEWFAAQGVAVPGRLPGPRLWHINLVLDAANRGQGIALANSLVLAHDQHQNLRPITVEPAPMPLTLGAYVFRARRERWRDPAILRFRHWIEKLAAQY